MNRALVENNHDRRRRPTWTLTNALINEYLPEKQQLALNQLVQTSKHKMNFTNFTWSL
jgi:hypothetical protein